MKNRSIPTHLIWHLLDGATTLMMPYGIAGAISRNAFHLPDVEQEIDTPEDLLNQARESNERVICEINALVAASLRAGR